MVVRLLLVGSLEAYGSCLWGPFWGPLRNIVPRSLFGLRILMSYRQNKKVQLCFLFWVSQLKIDSLIFTKIFPCLQVQIEIRLVLLLVITPDQGLTIVQLLFFAVNRVVNA